MAPEQSAPGRKIKLAENVRVSPLKKCISPLENRCIASDAFYDE